MRLARFTRAPILVGALVALAGCGGDDDSDKSSTKSSTAAEATVPAELLGTYETTLKKTDLPANPPGELTGSRDWKLTIAKSGGVNGGPVFGIAGADGRSLEGPSFSVKGDHIILHKEECAAGGDTRFYDNEYQYEQSGKRLEFTEVKNNCPDKVALTILTSEPWTKTN
jgi:hypothetical protein